jgi:hypothetical protein
MTENKNAKTPTDDGHVAHVYLFEKTGRPMVAWDNAKDIKLGDRLYVAPKHDYVIDCPRCGHCCPERTLVGLTDEEIHDLIYVSQKIDASNSPWFDCLGFYRAIEAKLKEKNQ